MLDDQHAHDNLACKLLKAPSATLYDTIEESGKVEDAVLLGILPLFCQLQCRAFLLLFFLLRNEVFPISLRVHVTFGQIQTPAARHRLRARLSVSTVRL